MAGRSRERRRGGLFSVDQQRGARAHERTLVSPQERDLLEINETPVVEEQAARDVSVGVQSPVGVTGAGGAQEGDQRALPDAFGIAANRTPPEFTEQDGRDA